MPSYGLIEVRAKVKSICEIYKYIMRKNITSFKSFSKLPLSFFKMLFIFSKKLFIFF